MTVSHLSDEQLSRMIAEHLEPLAQLKASGECAKIAWASKWTSDGVWGSHHREYEPLDMVNDPAMTLMLLTVAVSCEQESECEGDYLRLEHFCAALTSLRLKKDVSDLGRAVAEAYAIANHLEVKP